MNVDIEKLEAQLEAKKSKISALKAAIKGPVGGDSRRRFDNLMSKYAAAREKVEDLKAAGNASWDFHKADIWIAWNELENAFQDFQQSVLEKKRI